MLAFFWWFILTRNPKLKRSKSKFPPADLEFHTDLDSPTTPCPHHAASKTSVIDAQFQQTETTVCMHALGIALNYTASSSACLKCTIKDVVHTLTVYARDYKANRKNAKEDKKAMKAEVKFLFEEIKRDIKETWNAKA
ncbi:hypothetical protein BDV97DRAFT_369060 [Delphinella strobiligena]|nr:hypothetical protein BDV97DRAFT_369060 [Delphinella strobiligena]